MSAITELEQEEQKANALADALREIAALENYEPECGVRDEDFYSRLLMQAVNTAAEALKAFEGQP